MNVEAVRSVLRVVELGTVTRAAEALHVAQPALSRQIHGLERDLGQPLFVRQGRHLVLTPFGHRFVRQATVAIDDLNALERLAADQAASRNLTVGASLTTLSGFLPRVVARYRERAEAADITVRSGVSEEVYDLVAAGDVELGVVSAPRPRPFIVTRPLFSDPLWLICPADHPLAARPAASAHDLDGVPLVTMTPHTVLRQDLSALFTTFGVTPRVCMEIDNVGAIERMVEAGLGVSVLPRSVVVDLPALRALRAVPFRWPSRAITERTARRISIIQLRTPLSTPAQLWVAVCEEEGRRYGSLPS
jgi:DNA-binding transcriptional LysR family regulator